MGARSRSRSRGYIIGGKAVYYSGSSTAGYSGTNGQEVCSDVTMAPPYVVDHPLTITFTNTESVLRFDGRFYYGGPTRWVDYHGFNPVNRSATAYCPTVPFIDPALWLTKALANLDPWRPTIDVPLFLFEFKDMPSMLRHLGRVLSGRMAPHDVPGGWLAYSFGWAPLVSDLVSLFGIAEDVENRCRYLRNLESGKRVQRTLFSGELSNTVSTGAYVLSGPSTPVLLRADIQDTTIARIWYTANGKLKYPLPSSPGGLRTLSKRLVTGLSVRPADVWEFIPWTWLIDYFSNIGDYMKAYQGMVHFNTTRLCVMTTVKRSTRLINGQPAAGVTASESVMSTTRKTRIAYVNPTPQLTIKTFLSGTQMANLGALLTAGELKRVARR